MAVFNCCIQFTTIFATIQPILSVYTHFQQITPAFGCFGVLVPIFNPPHTSLLPYMLFQSRMVAFDCFRPNFLPKPTCFWPFWPYHTLSSPATRFDASPSRLHPFTTIQTCLYSLTCVPNVEQRLLTVFDLIYTDPCVFGRFSHTTLSWTLWHILTHPQWCLAVFESCAFKTMHPFPLMTTSMMTFWMNTWAAPYRRDEQLMLRLGCICSIDWILCIVELEL
jgi:hypothetical protein